MHQGVLVNHRVRLLLKKGCMSYRPRRTGERKRKSVRGCIYASDLSTINLVVVRKGPQEIPGLTDRVVPRRLGPKRASRIRKLFNLEKEDDVRKFVVRRPVPYKKDESKVKSKAPKIQRLITPQALQRKRHIRALRNRAQAKAKSEAAAYKHLLAERAKEAKARKAEEVQRRRSSRKSSAD